MQGVKHVVRHPFGSLGAPVFLGNKTVRKVTNAGRNGASKKQSSDFMLGPATTSLLEVSASAAFAHLRKQLLLEELLPRASTPTSNNASKKLMVGMALSHKRHSSCQELHQCPLPKSS